MAGLMGLGLLNRARQEHMLVIPNNIALARPDQERQRHDPFSHTFDLDQTL